jgi:hypothetical protein
MIETILLALAVWRLTSLLVDEDGPLDIFVKFRHLIGVRYDEYSNKYGKNVIANALLCHWCMSVWIGLLLAPLSKYSVNIPMLIVVALALSALSIIIDGVIRFSTLPTTN